MDDKRVIRIIKKVMPAVVSIAIAKHLEDLEKELPKELYPFIPSGPHGEKLQIPDSIVDKRGMVEVGGGAFLAAADALTILEQIEGALAYLDTVGTRAETASYKRMRMVLESAHRSLHNRMHQAGHYHEHTAPADHPEHHR